MTKGLTFIAGAALGFIVGGFVGYDGGVDDTANRFLAALDRGEPFLCPAKTSFVSKVELPVVQTSAGSFRPVIYGRIPETSKPSVNAAVQNGKLVVTLSVGDDWRCGYSSRISHVRLRRTAPRGRGFCRSLPPRKQLLPGNRQRIVPIHFAWSHEATERGCQSSEAPVSSFSNAFKGNEL